ncbi:hypothetical protein AB0M48_00820 [Lentzea sp. NPDC051208]|uniref:hypothetical protein n=1 Tax=Lentzea sp. NPDC051208 TaxID=3154642 RepID=UPI00342DCA99
MFTCHVAFMKERRLADEGAAEAWTARAATISTAEVAASKARHERILDSVTEAFADSPERHGIDVDELEAL